MIIICKGYAHLRNISKTFAKFQNDRSKIVGEIALTKYQLIASEMAKMLKKYLMIMSKPHAHFPTISKTYAKLQKDKVESSIVGGVSLTKHPLIAS